MELRDALTQITEIRLQLRGTRSFAAIGRCRWRSRGAWRCWRRSSRRRRSRIRSLRSGRICALDRGGGGERSGGGAGDDDPGAEFELADDPRDDLAGARAVLPVPRGRRAADRRARAGGPGEPLDAARPLADRLRLGIFASCRLLPRADLLGGRLLSRNRPGRARAGARRCGAIAVVDGPSLRGRPDPGRAVLYRTLERDHA